MKDGIHPSGYVGIRKPKKQTNAAKIIQADDVTLTDWDEDTIGTLDDFEIGSFENWLKETGYRSGELYVNYEEFCDIEYQDKEYMRNLLGDEELLKLYYEDIAND